MADSLAAARERAIAQLNDAFANDQLALDEFEARLTTAHHADTSAALVTLTSDLAVAPPSTALVPAGAPTIAASLVPARKTMVAVMTGVQRKGAWLPARLSRVFAWMGGAELDFREAQLAPGVTEVQVFAWMGGVQIIVPPTLAVEIDGSAFMGGFDHGDRATVALDPSRPVLRITGFAFMGGVQIETRLPGERAGDRRRRERAERRALRAERKALKPSGE